MEAFMGTIMAVGFSFAPRGWAFCSGQLMAISQNSALFSLLGTTYGGDGVTNFALPDLRGRVAGGGQPGAAPPGGVAQMVMGQTGGSNNATINATGTTTVTLTAANLPAHTHPGAGLTATTAVNVGLATTGGVGVAAAGSTLCCTAGGPGGANIYLPAATAPTTPVALGGVTTTVDGTTGSTGTGTPLAAPVSTQAITSVMQPFLGVNYIICTEGLFPSRN